jgi:hypothetical protein
MDSLVQRSKIIARIRSIRRDDFVNRLQRFDSWSEQFKRYLRRAKISENEFKSFVKICSARYGRRTRVSSAPSSSWRDWPTTGLSYGAESRGGV